MQKKSHANKQTNKMLYKPATTKLLKTGGALRITAQQRDTQVDRGRLTDGDNGKLQLSMLT